MNEQIFDTNPLFLRFNEDGSCEELEWSKGWDLVKEGSSIYETHDVIYARADVNDFKSAASTDDKLAVDFKVGMSENVHKRFKNYHTASPGGKAIGIFLFPKKIAKDAKSCSNPDKPFIEHLKKNGCFLIREQENRSNTEDYNKAGTEQLRTFFPYSLLIDKEKSHAYGFDRLQDLMVEQAKAYAYSKLCSAKVKEHLKLREWQKSALEKMRQAYNGSKKKFILCVVPQSGKTLVCLVFASSSGVKRLLVIAVVPTSIEASWKRDAEESGYAFIKAAGKSLDDVKEDVRLAESKGLRVLLFVSGQKADASLDIQEYITHDYNSEVVIADESHIGIDKIDDEDAYTNIAGLIKSLEERESPPFIIHSSGTNFREIATFDKNTSEKYEYDIEAARQDKLYDKSTLVTCKFTNELVEAHNRFDDEGHFSLQKFFVMKKNDDVFEHSDDIKKLFMRLFGKSSEPEPLRLLRPSRDVWTLGKELQKHKTILITLDEVAQCKAMKALLEDNIPNVECLSVAGSDCPSIDDVNYKLRYNEHYDKTTIILTCGRYGLGATFWNLTCVIVAWSVMTAEKNVQVWFRAMSPGKSNRKDSKRLIIDLHPERNIKVCFDLARYTKASDQSTEGKCVKLMSCLNLINASGSSFELQPLSEKDMKTLAQGHVSSCKNGKTLQSVSSSEFNEKNALQILDTSDNLPAASKKTAPKSRELSIACNGVETGKSNERVAGIIQSFDEKAAEKIRINELIKKAKDVLRRLPQFIGCTYKRVTIHYVRDFIDISPEHQKLFETMTKCQYLIFKKWIENNFIVKSALQKRIDEINSQINARDARDK